MNTLSYLISARAELIQLYEAMYQKDIFEDKTVRYHLIKYHILKLIGSLAEVIEEMEHDK